MFLGLSAGLLLQFSGSSASAANVSWLDRSWQSDDGLPDNGVSGVAQTPDGFLWVATAGGLMRFDGVEFLEIPLTGLEGIPNRVVRAMLLDRNGRLWLAMDRGPVINLAPDAIHVFTAGLPDGRAIGMADDAEGAIWVSYANSVVCRLLDGKAQVFSAREGLPPGGNCSLASDVEGRLWFGKGPAVGVYRAGKFETLATLPDPVWCLGRRRQGGIWICAGQRLLRCAEGGQPEEVARLPQGPEGPEPRVLLEDRGGAVWLGTAADGLFRFAGGKFEPVPTSHRELACLAQDREGNLWAGTGGGGLNRLRPRVVQLLGTESGLPFESVRSACEDSTGALWVTTQNGLLAKWQGGLWTTISRETNWPGGHAACVAADRNGGVWIGTHDRGLHHWQAGRYQSWRQQNGLASDNVRSVLESTSGDLWLATDSPSKLQQLHGTDLRTLELPPRIRSLRAMAEDAQGNVWIGSAEGLLLRAGGDGMVNETPASSPRLLSIRCLSATPDGSLWIGYAGWGLGRLKDGHFSRLTAEQGLNDDYLSQLVADGSGWMWCAGNRGLFRVRLADLQNAAEGGASRLRSISYGRGEGLANLQPNYENFPGAFRSRDGRLLFPLRTGLAIVHPANIQPNPLPPPVLLEHVTVDGKTVALYDRYLPSQSPAPADVAELRVMDRALRLRPEHRKLDFAFTALSFTAPENVRFQYQLEGFDDDWVEAGTQRAASYSRLPAADYRFRVKACNDAGVWNENGVVFGFTVAPFFWQTWQFRAGGAAAFTLAVIGLVRYVFFRRLRRQLRLLEQQTALDKERARIAKDIHDDLGASLTQIALLGELAQQDSLSPDKASERVGRISTTARQAIRSLDEIVWAVNPRNDTLAHLIDYTGQFTLDYLRLAGIRCRLDFPEQAPPRQVSTDARHNLFLAIKEALTNIVKHAQATEVWLRISAEPDTLRIVVEDNGRGFDGAPQDAFAEGLRNMRQRLAELGGRCELESRPGTGTKVNFELPWPRD